MDTLAHQLAELSPEQRRLIELWLHRPPAEPDPPRSDQPIPRYRSPDPAPLSFAQQRLWFLHQLAPTSPAYNLRTIVRIHGPLDVARLSRALAALVARHEILRTSFPALDGQPYQRIAPARPLGLPLIALGTLPPAEQPARLDELALAQTEQPFDLAEGPLFRAHLLRLDRTTHVLLLTMHHSISDAWSQGIQLRELLALYAALGPGRSNPLPELPIQYADFARWQRQAGQARHLAGELAYWHAQFGHTPPALDLPTDRPRPLHATTNGAWHYYTLPAALRDQLQAYSRQAGVTLFMTLLAAYATLLYRYTSQDDIVVGTPVAGRTHGELEELIGCFVNMLPLRIALDGNPPFHDLLQRVRTLTLSAYAHQAVPFEQVVDSLQLPRDLGRNPLFQVLFVLQNTPLPELHGAGLTLQPMEVHSTTAVLDLALYLRVVEAGLLIRVEYNTDLFDAATMQRLLGHFHTLLAGIIAGPASRLDTLPLLTGTERQQLLFDWNATQAEWPATSLITQFQDQAARRPDAIALVYAGQQITYRELNRRANHLAHHLRGLGVGPEMLVGIGLERSPALVLAVLGVLKAGGAYVPLDPAYPPDRLAFMLEETHAPILITQKEIRDWRLEISRPDQSLISNLQSPTAINLEHDWPTIAQAPDTNLDSDTMPDQLAYVLYTSGSTGRPKGVLGLHGGILNRLAWMWHTYPWVDGEAGALTTSLNFVDAVWELFGPLLQGQPLVLIAEDIVRDPPQLVIELARSSVTRLVLVPALLDALLTSEPGLAQHLPHLRSWTSSGEVLPAALAQRFQARHPGALLLNLYGSSEVAADALWYELPQPPPAPVPLGRPIANMRVHVLDRAMQPVPIGVPGEVYIGGCGLARGYLHRPDLTAERFVPNPFADQRLEIRDWRLSDTESPISNLQSLISMGTRLYKTGDWARRRAGGALEYLGRHDQQVKLRGFRIELGEIEAALQQHPAVGTAVVVLRADARGEAQLVAYLTQEPRTKNQEPASLEQRTENKEQNRQEPRTKNQEPISGDPGSRFSVLGSGDGLGSRFSVLGSGELRTFLGARLPEYMIPSAYVFLEALPLTPNGKVDRRALPALEPAAPRTRATITAPRTATEAQLAHIWGELLGQAAIEIDDTFFALGGHSLQAAQVMARVRAAFGVELPLRSLFETPTVAGLAAWIDRARGELAGTQAQVTIQPAERNDTAPLSYSQERMWALDQLDPARSAFNLPAVLHLTGALDLTALRRSLAEIARRHAVLRTTIATVDGQLIQVAGPAAPVYLPLIDLSPLPPAVREYTIRQLAATEARQPFDLTRDRPLRASVLRAGLDEHLLLLTMHHLFSDGWSLGILLQEIATLYDAYSSGRPAAMPELPIQYADYAIWQRQVLQGATLEAELAYWRQRLAIIPPSLGPQPAFGSAPAARYTFALSPRLAEALRVLSRREGNFLFITLLTALKLVVARWIGQDDIVVGASNANRDRVETRGLIGFFANMLVLRSDLSGDPTFGEALRRVREAYLEAYAHRQLPIEQLLEAVQHTHIEVVFNFIPDADRLLATAQPRGLTVRQVDLELEQIYQFANLVLIIVERAGGLSGSLVYKVDLFDAATIRQFAAAYLAILEELSECEMEAGP